MTIATELPAITADTSSVALYSEYTGIPVEIVEQCATKFGAFNQVTWSECEGATFCDKAKVYYENTDEYLFDLLHGSRSKAWRKQVYQHFGHWQWMTSIGPDVIEFGGGLGLTCSLLRDEGRRVTYCDVDGPAAKFARWYFERTGQRDIEILHTPSSELVLPEGRQWDLVFSDSVIEHVPDPAATVERLARALKPGGTLITHEPGEGHATQPDSLEAVRRYGVTERDMPPRHIVRVARQIGFRGARCYPLPDDIFRASYLSPRAARFPGAAGRAGPTTWKKWWRSSPG